jgi:DNA-binding CsgD family transcriptional regulator
VLQPPPNGAAARISRQLSCCFAIGQALMMSPQTSNEELTPREAAVLALIMQGETSRAAGISLGISPRTVEFHRANIMLKLSAKNVADLMRIVLTK